MVDAVVKYIRDSRSCVVLTGAGISAESGVPTFRGQEGLWGKFRPEELATMSAFLANSKMVWEWYNWRRQVIAQVKPNPGHYALAELPRWFERFTLITQNVDGLHRAAGSVDVLELHGSLYRDKCADCNRPFAGGKDIDPDNIPVCPHCAGKIRPDVVWFGEMLDARIIDRAFAESERAELFFSIGTSAIVHPAASLPVAANRSGATLIEINPEATPLTALADLYVPAQSGAFLPEVVESLRRVGSQSAKRGNDVGKSR
ncbi:MAG TPA: NAD-dependent deacylase [Candidatus Deferrimicrobium sp.]|nr:NAD-dependent deacylase [Candidatus Deferrimicrobium sp.]